MCVCVCVCVCEMVENPLKFWISTDCKMPDLARFARRILVIQASSGAGNITTPQRSLLSPDVVETLVVLKDCLLYTSPSPRD